MQAQAHDLVNLAEILPPLLPVLFPHPTSPSCQPSLLPPCHPSSWRNEKELLSMH